MAFRLTSQAHSFHHSTPTLQRDRGRGSASTPRVASSVVLPTQEERAEMNALDRKLDAIAAKLKQAQTLKLSE